MTEREKNEGQLVVWERWIIDLMASVCSLFGARARAGNGSWLSKLLLSFYSFLFFLFMKCNHYVSAAYLVMY